jgi:hypothetical protein
MYTTVSTSGTKTNSGAAVLLVIAGVLAVAFSVAQVMMPDTATVSPRILSKRTVAASFFYSICSGGAIVK